jgi:hypothetical protein
VEDIYFFRFSGFCGIFSLMTFFGGGRGVQHGGGVTQCSKFFPSILWGCSSIFTVTGAGWGGCWIEWEEGSVGYVARSEIIMASEISRRGRRDRTCTEPMGVEVPRLALFRATSGKCAGGWMWVVYFCASGVCVEANCLRMVRLQFLENTLFPSFRAWIRGFCDVLQDSVSSQLC